MKMVMDVDGWFVSTPVFVGTEDQVVAAAKCNHKWEEGGIVTPEGDVVLQRCHTCVAQRVKAKMAGERFPLTQQGFREIVANEDKS